MSGADDASRACIHVCETEALLPLFSHALGLGVGKVDGIGEGGEVGDGVGAIVGDSLGNEDGAGVS